MKKFLHAPSTTTLLGVFLNGLLLAPTAWGDPPPEEWVARYNSPGLGAQEVAIDMAIDKLGNVYVTGSVDITGSSETGEINIDYLTIKYDSAGNEQWVARYDGTANGADQASAIGVDSSGNVYVTGTSDGSDTRSDYATIKYDSMGNELWVVRYNNSTIRSAYARAISVDNSGNAYVTGNTYGSSSDYATIKYDSEGNEQWVAHYNGPASRSDRVRAIDVDDNGNAYVTGRSEGSGTGYDYATVKYDSAGNEQWVARYNGPGNGSDEAHTITVDKSGNTYLTGRSYGSDTRSDYATIKYDSIGNEQWVARYSAPGDGSAGYAYALTVDDDGYVYVTGSTDGSGTYDDYATVKYDSAGNEQWVARYNGPSNASDWARAIGVDNNGNVYVTGQSSGLGVDYATVKYDSMGNEQWVARYNGQVNSTGSDFAYDLAVDDSGNVYVTGGSEGSGGDLDYVTIKYTGNITESNTAPTLALIGNREGFEDYLLEFTISASDPDVSDVLTFSASNLPTGAIFDASSATFSWIPDFTQAGVYESIEFTVTDNGDPIELDTELINITIGNVNRPPIITPIYPISSLENEPIEFLVEATDPDGNLVTYSVGVLPDGAYFDATNGSFSWIPDSTQAGNYTIVIFATDNGEPALTAQVEALISVGDIPTPTELAVAVVNTVVALDLPNNQENAYLANLKKIEKFIAEGKVIPAANQLYAFIIKVEQDIIKGDIDEETGNNLIVMALGLLGEMLIITLTPIN